MFVLQLPVSFLFCSFRLDSLCTVGMDPVSRRQVWDLVERVKKNRITVLTTHSMEEVGV